MSDTSGRDTPVACTVVARNYLPAARVLARSYVEHHPDHRFVIAVIDDRDGTTETGGAGYEVVGPAALDIEREDFLRMATAYSVTELATAVKPYLLRALRRQADVVLYLDPDIRVFAPMPELVELASAHGLVLTPHFLRPLPRDGKEPDEAVIMGTGLFNLGFLATGPGSDEFLDFWAERLRHDAIVAPERQLFTDQRWVDQVPSLYEHHILRDPGFNVAYWNTHERTVERAGDGTLTAGGKPLRFFHFSGYRPERPWLLTYHCARKPRTLLSDQPVLRELCDAYGAALQDAGYAESLETVPYGFAKLDDGTMLTPIIRRLFRDAWITAERKGKPLPPHGFGTDGGAALRDWLSSPETTAQAGAGLNRLTTAVWESRPDLRGAFPHPYGEDALHFRHWCRQSGPAEKVLPEWALPAEPEPPRPPVDEFGVNVVGYLTAELGLGEMGRIVHNAIRSAGIPVSSVVEERSLSNRTGLAKPETVGTPRFPVSLLCVNADQTSVILDNHAEVGRDRYRIGLWAWELEDFPAWLHSAFDLVDEVWTISEFCRTAISRHATVPVKAIPVPVPDPGQTSVRERRPGEPVRFLFAFDFNSIGERKNPWGLVTAFRRAFGDRDDVRLVIKAINGDLNAQAAERLRIAIAGDPRIELLERYLSVAELHDLYATSDCYVSLHRSEGFGLTVSEAMARGLPVISTDYSSTTEFLDERTGWPVPYTLTKVGPGCYPYHEDAVWADPDLDVAAEAMRTVADDPAEAARRGAAAREHVLSTRPMSVAADWMAEQLRAAYQSWRSRAGTDLNGADDPLGPLRASRSALHWRPEAGSASRTPLAPAMRKVVLRALDHYDVHQRRVLGAITDGVEDTVGRLVARVEALEKKLGAAHETIAGLESLCETLPGTELALRNLERDVAELRDETSAERRAREATRDVVDELRDRVAADAQRTFEMFAERDVRIDADELTLRQVKRDVGAAHEAAALRHAPVPAGAEVVLCDAGALLLPRDGVVAPWLAYHRSWEDSEAELMAELMSSGSTPAAFLDIGAHVGYHTLRLLRSCPQVERVVAIEANRDSAELMRRNVAVNLPGPVAERVTVLPVAAWDEDTTVRLVHAEEGNSGDHRVQVGAGAGTSVRAMRLDGVPEVLAGRVRLIKVDLQGRDHRALAGLTGVLDRDAPHVVCEFCPAAITELGDDPEQVLRDYRKLGYRPRPLDESGVLTGQFGDAELIELAMKADSTFVTLWLVPQG